MNLKLVIPLSDIRRATKAECAEFFEIALPTLENWVRRGCPFVQRGGRGVPWVFDLLAVAKWHYAPESEVNPDDPMTLPPAERKAWYESEIKRRDLQVRDRELIQSSEVEQVVATAFASIAQSIRSLPDNMERQLGMSPEAVERMTVAIDEYMDELADRLSKMTPAAVTDD